MAATIACERAGPGKRSDCVGRMRLVCVRCGLRFTGATLRSRYVAWQCCGLIAWYLGRYMQPTATPPEQSPNGATLEQPEQEKRPPRLLFLVRHGQTTFNVEGRLPGQMEGV